MTALLDVNVLVALFDPAHIHHGLAHDWLAGNRKKGWASCPLTENGFVRVISNPAYPGRKTTLDDAIARLQVFRDTGDHEFWPDSISICDSGLFRTHDVGGHTQLTDVYLLSLAVVNGGRLATFDLRINLSSVAAARPHHLQILG